MAVRKDVKRKRSAAQVTGEDPATAPVASESPVEDLALSTRVVNVLTNAGIATVQDVLDMLNGSEKIPGVADKTLEEIRDRLAEKGLLEHEGEKAEVERERQAGTEAERAGAEPKINLAEATKGRATDRKNMESSLTAPGEKRERQLTFIVRLVVDEKGQPLRTEVQLAKSDNTETFLGLDVQRLTAFMEKYAKLQVASEATISATHPPDKVEAAKPKDLTPESSLTVSDVRVFRESVTGVAALDFCAGEELVADVRFQVHGPEAPALSAQEESFEVNVFAYEVTSGTSSLLSAHRDNLVENVLEYRTQLLIPELSPGIYRLTTLVRLLKMLGEHEGPIVHITGIQTSGDSVASREAALST